MPRIASLGEGQAVQLNALATHPAVQNPRQTGTITAFEVGEGSGYLSDLAPRMLALFRERNVLLRPLGNTIYVKPPYCISSEQLDCIYDTIREVIDDVT